MLRLSSRHYLVSLMVILFIVAPTSAQSNTPQSSFDYVYPPHYYYREGGESSGTAVTLGAGAALVGLGALVIGMRPRVSIKPNLDPDIRQQWEDNAHPEAPNVPCQVGAYWCRMTKVEPQYHRYQATQLRVVGIENFQSRPRETHELSDGLLQRLNHELFMLRTPSAREGLYDRLIFMARAIWDEVRWLTEIKGVEYLSFQVGIAGSEIDFEFTLYQCNGVEWVAQTSWTTTLSDNRDMNLGSLPNAINTSEYEKLVRQLADGLGSMFNKI